MGEKTPGGSTYMKLEFKDEYNSSSTSIFLPKSATFIWTLN